MRKAFRWVKASRARKVAAGTLATFLVAAASFAFYSLIVNTSGSGSGTENAGPATTVNVSLALHASWPNNQLAPPGGAVGTAPPTLPLTLTADNSSSTAGTVRTVTFTGATSSNGACNTVLQNSANGIDIMWPDGLNSGPGAQYATGFQEGGNTYTEASPVTVAGNSTGTNILPAAASSASVFWFEDGVNDSACAGQPIELDFTASS